TTVLGQMCAGGSTEVEECPRCEDERCCETRQACRDAPECLPFLYCIQACPQDDGSIPCHQQCAIDHEAGLAAFADKFTCIIGECNTECGGYACTDCTAKSCPNTYTACQ